MLILMVIVELKVECNLKYDKKLKLTSIHEKKRDKNVNESEGSAD